MRSGGREQRVAAYAVILRDDAILLSRIAPRVTTRELWTLPGGGLDHGEDPRSAVIREIREETGLDAEVGETTRVFSAHMPDAWRRGRRVDSHALRIVYDGWVAPDAPAPRTLEVDGSTVEAAWVPLADVLDGTVPTVDLVTTALDGHLTHRHQRIAAYAVVVRDAPDHAVLLTQLSDRGPRPGWWTLPGGGVDHGEAPRDAVVREVHEETGLRLTPGEVLDVASSHFVGTAPGGRREDFHGVQVVYVGSVDDAETAVPRVIEVRGTTAEAAWVPLEQVGDADHPVRPLVQEALAGLARRGVRA